MTIHITYPQVMTFIHLEKNGGISFKRWCYEYLQPENYSNVISKHASLPMVRNKIKNPGFIFSIVRNPFARELSWYNYIKKKTYVKRNKILAKTQGKKSVVKFDKVIDEIETLTMKEYILSKKTITPQSVRLNGNIDYVMKLEQIDKDFKVIQEMLDVHDSLPAYNVINNDLDYKNYFDTELKNFVYNKHKNDFEIFDYEF